MGLFLLGFVHLLFIWSGDILHLYAFLGIPLIVLIQRPNKLIWATMVVVFFFPFWSDVVGRLQIIVYNGNWEMLTTYNRADLIAIYREGTYLDLMPIRIYEFVIAWLYQSDVFRKRLRFFIPVGRMALSNYILQSVLGLFFFSSLGMGWYEQLSPFECVLFVLTIYGFQLISSYYWFQYFKYGLLERAWRSFSYRKLLPIKKG